MWQKYLATLPYDDGTCAGYFFVNVVASGSSVPGDWKASGRPFDDYNKAYRSAQRQEKKINGYIIEQ